MQARDIAISIQDHPEFRYISPLQKILYCGTYIYAPTQESDVTGKLAEMINSDPGLFLERYGEMLNDTELTYFSNNNSYEVKRYLTTCQDLKAKETLKRNRRFTKLHQLIEEGDYFSEEAIKSRAPELYHEYVGKYRRTDDETWQNLSLSQALIKLQQRAEDRQKFGDELEDISPEELQDNEDLLIRIMHERFIDGTDRIEGVSDDETLDDIKQIDQDAEDKYFEI
jgi:hypothetical protein